MEGRCNISNKDRDSVFSRVFRLYIKPHTFDVIKIFVAMCISALATTSLAYLIDPVINKIFIEKNITKLYNLVWIIGGTIFINAIATYCHKSMMIVFESKICTKIFQDLFNKLVMLKIEDYDNIKTGKITTYFNNDLQNIKTMINTTIISCSKEILTIVILVCIMFSKNFTLTCIALFGFPLAFIPLGKIAKKLHKIYKMVLEKQEYINIVLQNVFNGIKAVKSFCTEELEKNNMKNNLNKLLTLQIKSGKIGSIGSPMMEFIGGLAGIGIILYGGTQVINGNMTSGAFFSFSASLFMLYKPLKSLSNLGISVQNGYISLSRIFQILDMKEDLYYDKGLQNIDLSNANINIHNLSFQYKNRNTSAISNININIKSGEKIALVGQSGSGKSTIIGLLLKFYNSQSGEIIINEHNIKNINTSILRKNISYVAQDFAVFDGTILSNITYGIDNYTESELQNALKLSNTIDFINEMPFKLHTQIGDFGSQLSMGQRQRLVIARVILKNAPIVILDEATSALDNTTENEIQQAIKILTKNKTTIIIAHRLQNVTICDKIYLLSEGKIIESGDHNALLNRENSQYFKLWHGKYD